MRTILKLLARHYPPPGGGNNPDPAAAHTGHRTKAARQITGEPLANEGPESWVDAYGRALWQEALVAWFRVRAEAWQLRALPHLPFAFTSTHTSRPAVAVLRRGSSGTADRADVPFALFEIPAAHEPLDRLLPHLQEYAAVGIPHIWVIRPASETYFHLVEGALVPATHFGEAGTEIYFPLSAVADFIR